VPPLTTALALRSKALRQGPSIETRPQNAVCVRSWWRREFKRQGGISGSSSKTQKQKPGLSEKQVRAALRRTRQRRARAANLPTPRMRDMAFVACSAIPASAQAFTLAPPEMLRRGGQFGVQRLEISSKRVDQRLLRTVACRGL
jgi:hypothetical protein